MKSWKPAKLGGGLGGRHYTKPKPLLRSQRSDGYSGSSERGGSFRGSSSGGRGGFRGGASRRGSSDRYSSSNSGGVGRRLTAVTGGHRTTVAADPGRITIETAGSLRVARTTVVTRAAVTTVIGVQDADTISFYFTL